MNIFEDDREGTEESQTVLPLINIVKENGNEELFTNYSPLNNSLFDSSTKSVVKFMNFSNK